MHGSAAKAADGSIYLALTNLDPNQPAQVQVKLEHAALTRVVSGQILTAPAITSLNTHQQPDAVKPQDFTAARIDGSSLNVALPAKAIVMLRLH